MSSLRFRIALFAFALSCIPILVLGIISTNRSQIYLRAQSLELQTALAERVRLEVEHYIDLRINDLRVLERISILPRMSNPERRERLERLLVHEQAFHELALFDSNGVNQWVSRIDTGVGESPVVSSASIDEGFSKSRLVVGAPKFDHDIREPLIDIVLPVIDRRSGETTLVLAAVVRIKPIWDLLAALELPEGSDAYVIDAGRQILAHKTPSTVLANLNLEIDVLSASEEELLMIETPLALGDSKTSVVITRSAPVALRLAIDSRNLMLILTVIAIGVAGVLGFVLARRVSAPVEHLAQVASRIAEGDFDVKTLKQGPTEIQALGKALVTMSERLSEQFKQLANAEFAARQLAHVTLDSIGDAVISTDKDSIVVYMNPVAEQLTGWSAANAEGQPLETVFNIINEHTREPVPTPLRRVFSEGKVQGLANHTVLISQDGQEYAIQDSAAPIRSIDGDILGAVMVFSDVTEARALEQQITHQATHDSLTDLVNRPEFEHRLNRVLDSIRDSDAVHALFYMDLDQFKIINDTCGHSAGDEMLRQISTLFLAHIRNRDTLGRIGGDEFVVLMEHCDIEHAIRVAEQLRKSVEELRFPWEERIFSLGVSIGVVEIDRNSQGINEVLQAADNACYLAKEAGRNRIHVYHEDGQAMTERREEMHWISILTQALEQDRFELHAQKIFAFGDEQAQLPQHYELLIRMVDTDGQPILPTVFIRAAERYNLMVSIDRWVVEHTLFWLANQNGENALTLWGINLSGQSLGDEHFLDFVLQLLDQTGVRGEQLCFEITETAAISNLARAKIFIQAVRQRGCKMALDDFGSGLSSFAYLKTLHVDYLKIDGIFVKDMVDDEFDLAMVRSINEIGQLLGMLTIAEFVESPMILERIRELGVDAAQGFEVGMPERLIYAPFTSSS